MYEFFTQYSKKLSVGGQALGLFKMHAYYSMTRSRVLFLRP